ncbi:MAG: hypothetical protein A3C06_03270 [Candidatus Taylorbacteria bacterium RIFCSPHIGHO2_02_FULL_46_13]|uniref:Uncharacterized protein n=1 Tax=Candidatus Taylorbacteria bacterium RIFCSPHIGHO2_02_FULL_46_13 TaxID=1802312 RepID=A0A1G2MRT6_9BACT|nr:MAG: hypothetical protein A3C06_03270 [Candidatus Taylorbacteria bacterium RIFCSPHIGHO2_02_FULL_46_13]
MEHAQIKERGKEFSWAQTIGLGVITLLVVTGVWTAIQIGPYLPDTVSRLAQALVTMSQTFIPGEKLTLYSDQTTLHSGDETVMSWVHKNKKGDGVYSLWYPCVDKLYLGVKTETGDKTLLCDMKSTLYSKDDLVTIIAVSENDQATAIPVALFYTRSDDSANPLSSSVTISIIGDTKEPPSEISPTLKPVEPAAATPTPPIVTAPVKKAPTAGTRTEKTYVVGTTTKPAQPYGKTDLAPRILEVGTIDKVTNAFTATTTLRASDRIAVRFEVENLGTANSGHWQFNAVLPTFPNYIFESDGQQPLAPGDKIEYTIGFDNVELDTDGRFVINVDPTSSIPEASESNNIATTTIRVSTR